MKSFNRSALAVACVMSVALTAPAYAYGPEGMFGGRPDPHSTIILDNPVQLTNDRPDRAESVLNHPRPDYDAVPIDVGSFELFPSLEIGETFDSNIYASNTSKKSDGITSVRPIVTLMSNWNRHAVSMTSYGDINAYNNNTHENYQNFVSEWNGRYDIRNQSWFAVRGGYQHLSESRSSPDAANGVEPTMFNLAKGGVSYYRGVGLLKVTADYDIKRFDFQNSMNSDGVEIDQSGRNRYEHVVGGKVGYDVSANVKPYVSAHFNDHDYDVNKTEQSRGYDAVVGSVFDFGGITSLDVFAGATEQNYRNSTLEQDVLVPKFGGRIDWNVTGLTSVVLEVSRTIEDTTVTNYNSYVATGGSLTVTHELLRNLLIEGDMGFTRDDFHGADVRKDDVLTAGLGARYFLNRRVYSDLFYTYQNRNSTDSASEFDRNVVMLRVGVRP